jgi:shikimate dehydrogenase
MTANYKSELVGVLGYPVAENPTCVMQEAAFAALGLQWRYLTIEVEPQALPDALRGVRAFGMRGINLTIPHKVAVMPLLDEVSPDAAMIGAVNTVRRVGNRLVGENTKPSEKSSTPIALRITKNKSLTCFAACVR